eukprot:TRINITY_DN17321_c0_g1_i1.p1 TRINITY_DN17321_c0_g1~~TRINITY_DN17321_c0_g1_i1.p1  ORF type:complete len:250 (+),score=12.91 TRINITY_DN17321_c0_g1_i1:694-1443(+)
MLGNHGNTSRSVQRAVTCPQLLLCTQVRMLFIGVLVLIVSAFSSSAWNGIEVQSNTCANDSSPFSGYSFNQGSASVSGGVDWLDAPLNCSQSVWVDCEGFPTSQLVWFPVRLTTTVKNPKLVAVLGNSASTSFQLALYNPQKNLVPGTVTTIVDVKTNDRQWFIFKLDNVIHAKPGVWHIGMLTNSTSLSVRGGANNNRGIANLQWKNSVQCITPWQGIGGGPDTFPPTVLTDLGVNQGPLSFGIIGNL